MEETLSHIVRGCKLARELESNIPNLAKQPRMLAKSCDEIMKIFGTAKERLNAQDDHSAYPYMFAQASGMETSGEMQEWLKTSYLQALQAQYGLTESKVGGIEPVTLSGHPGFELGGRDREGSARSTGSGGEFQAMEGSDSGNSNSQRSRRRKDDIRKRKETVAAPRIGNTDIPPDDNFTWRKYGQKEILGSKYPRSYYRCTHQKLYNCPAKKQVQRLDHDPFMFDITYIDDHTCHKSATAPSVPPPPPEVTPEMIQATTAQLPMGRWLSMELKPTGEAANAFVDHSQVQMHVDLGLGEGSSSSMVGTGGSTAGPSMVRFGREAEYPVVDLADTMFNSGSSSSNSMDFLFTHTEDKWEPAGDKKK
ncbi:hypothetical protein AAG906_008458 [Vitis piasezkii]